MTDWTDEELGDLLAKTFRSHEELADPEKARTLAAFASMPRRRRWPAVTAAAAAVVLVAGGTAYLVHRDGQAPPDSAPVTSTIPAGTAANLATASRLSASLLHALPMPPGSVESDRSPTKLVDTPWWRPTHPGLAHKTWWTVPMTKTEFETWLREHPPAGLRADGPSGASSVTGAWVYDREFDGAGTTAYGPPALDVAYLPQGDHLVVRVSTYVGARHARTTFVPDNTNGVEIRLVTTTTDARQRKTTTATTVTDRTAVDRLVRRFNDLPGTSVEPVTHACASVPLTKAYTLRFIGPGGEYTVTGEQDNCYDQLDLRHNGRNIGPAVDADDAFFKAADALLGG